MTDPQGEARPRVAGASPIGRGLRPAYPVTTARLRLRPLTQDDIPGLLAYRGDPAVCRYLPFEPMTAEVLQQRLTGDLGRDHIAQEGESLTLGVELVEGGELIGDVVLFFRSVEHGAGEIGYVFRADLEGHGYATEACAAILTLAFGDLGLHRVVAQMDARNLRSARLAQRLRMRQEAHFHSDRFFKGEWSDLVIYAILAEVLPGR